MRAECLGGPRPCPWVSCRYHLWTEQLVYLNPRKRGQPRRGHRLTVEQMIDAELASCALDVADDSSGHGQPRHGREYDAGGASLGVIAAALGITLEGARATERRALRKLKNRAGDYLAALDTREGSHE